MRVQIRYGVELEDIPQEVSMLMTKAQKVLYKTDGAFLTCTKELDKEKGEVNFFAVQSCVTEAREALAKADMLLSDSFSILAGYQQAKLNQAVTNSLEGEQEVPDGEEVQEG
jgi:hypothetical protein